MRMRLLARALHAVARSHDPITAPERLESIHGFKSPLPANRQAHQNSRVMRFAKVKEEAAQRAGDTQQSASPGCFISGRDVCLGLVSLAQYFEPRPDGTTSLD